METWHLPIWPAYGGSGARWVATTITITAATTFVTQCRTQSHCACVCVFACVSTIQTLHVLHKEGSKVQVQTRKRERERERQSETKTKRRGNAEQNKGNDNAATKRHQMLFL